MRPFPFTMATLVLAAAIAAPSRPAPLAESLEPARCSSSSSAKRGSSAKKKSAPKRTSGLTRTYRRLRARWHMKPSPAERRKWIAEENPPLVIKPVHANEAFEIRPDPETGAFDEEALAVAMEAFHWKADGSTHPVDDRLIELIYRAVKRYKAPYVHLVSGYRNRNGRGSSRHNQGRAADIVLPGVGDAQLAAFFRRQGFVGVGFYPVSGFTHVDVRERSYYWVDRSGPGQRSRERAIRGKDVARNDARARRRGERATPPYDQTETAEEVLASAETSSEDD